MAPQQEQALTTRRDDVLAPFREQLAKNMKSFEAALPQTVKKFLTPERLTKIVLVGLSRNPTLLSCTPQSVLRSVMDLAALGLEPCSALQQAYLVPFKNNTTTPPTMEAIPIVGYRGYVTLARRSGEIASVAAHGVHARDVFDIDLGEGTLTHKPYKPAPIDIEGKSDEELDRHFNRGQLLGVYCVARFVGGGHHMDYMTLGDVERIRRRSRARDNSPWATDYNEMAKKTVVRRASKYWPLSIEMAQAMEIEDNAERGDEQIGAGLIVFDEALPPAQEPKSTTDKVLQQLQAKSAVTPLATAPAASAAAAVVNETRSKPADEGLDEAEKRWAAEQAAKPETKTATEKPKAAKGQAKKEAPKETPKASAPPVGELAAFIVAVANATTDEELTDMFRQTGKMASADVSAARAAINARRVEIEFPDAKAATPPENGREPGSDDHLQPAGTGENDGWQ